MLLIKKLFPQKFNCINKKFGNKNQRKTDNYNNFCLSNNFGDKPFVDSN